ncbi:hypothetical protein GCM10025857_21210 [Alicyclobacillus contaminans]|nr:hypothetical protein GCM10025857_21210 [Alicyclobacillus contaminans]
MRCAQRYESLLKVIVSVFRFHYNGASNALERGADMPLQAGIVGLPNVGKSTLFNAITRAGAEAANYPFCTIDPNVGVVEVPDPRLQALAEIVHPRRIVPTAFEFVDIAGLVAGASKGRGLATSSSATSVRWTPSSMWSGASKMETSRMFPALWIPSAT